MFAFALRLVRPYWKLLVLAVAAMLIETAMILAAPWPLKVVLDSVLNSLPPPGPLARLFNVTRIDS